MAVIDLSSNNAYPYVKSIGSVGTTQQEITLPDTARTVSVGGDVESRLVLSGVSDGGAVPADFITIPAGNLVEVNLPSGKEQRIGSIAVAASTGTANITVILEAK